MSSARNMAKHLPNTFKKLIVNRITHKFREAADIMTVEMPKPGPTDVIVKNRYVGINASDINLTAGRYDPTLKTPFDCGMEAVGEVVSVGSNCKRLRIGQPVGFIYSAAFAEYTMLPEHFVIPLPAQKTEYVSLLVSGLTAAVSLGEVGEIQKGETVLVTAAAGGTGQYAVQIAKNKGCHVIGTCSTDEKVAFLKKIGCDRAINYKTENLKNVLKTEYPNGLDVVYESIGGEMFDTCVNSLAVKGRLIVIGFISGYDSASGVAASRTLATLPARLLGKSASVRAFFLMNYAPDWKQYMKLLVHDVEERKIHPTVDLGANCPSGPFVGLEAVYDAVDYLYTRKSVGKIIVDLSTHDSRL